MVILAALGRRPSLGYDILITSALRDSAGIEVFRVRSKPTQGCPVPAAITEPVDLARVPTSDLPVRFTERITLEAPHRVVFTRIAGPVLGTIANEVEGADDDLRLRFSFALVVAGVSGGSSEEREYADGMTADYLKAVAATLTAMRRIAAGETVPA